MVEKDVEMLANGPTVTRAELAAITTRTLVMAGGDESGSVVPTFELYQEISDAELAIVPGTSRFRTLEKPALRAAIIVDLLVNDPVPTAGPPRPLS